MNKVVLIAAILNMPLLLAGCETVYGSGGNSNPNSTSNAEGAPDSSGNTGGGGLSVADVLDIGNVLVTGMTAAQNVRPPAPTNVSGGVNGGGSAACPQIRANYESCKKSWQNSGSIGVAPSTTSGQAGSFYTCMQTYQNAGIASRCPGF